MLDLKTERTPTWYSSRRVAETRSGYKVLVEEGTEMVGTTRSRVNLFMNKFKKLGFIDYKSNYSGGIQIHNSLLSVVLHE